MSFKEKIEWYLSERGTFIIACLLGVLITMIGLHLIINIILDFKLPISNIDTSGFETRIKNRMLRYVFIEIGVFIFIYVGLIIKDYFKFFKNKF